MPRPIYMLLAVFLSGVALGVSEDPQAVTLLQQHGLHLTLSSQEDLSLLSKLRFMPHNSLAVPTLDANGRLCLMCDLPPAERAPNQSYVQRTDCGNHSVFEDAAILQVPLSTFQQNATEEHNQTFGWCELNVQKSCADAVYNKDYMLFAKSILVHELAPGVASWDQYFCFYNGWLSSEIKALQHDFQGMYAKGRDFCNSEDLIKRGSQGNRSQKFEPSETLAQFHRGGLAV